MDRCYNPAPCCRGPYCGSSRNECVRALAERGVEGDPVGAWAELDLRRRRGLTEVESLKHERNTASKEIGRLKQAGEDGERGDRPRR